MASNSGGIRAGQAYVEATVDQSRLQSGLKNAAVTLKGFAGNVRGIFASAFGPVGTALERVYGLVEGPLGNAFGFLGDQVQGLFQSTTIEKFGAGIADAGLQVKAIWDLVYTQLGRVVEGLLQNLQPAFDKGLLAVKGLLSAIENWLTANEQVITDFIKIGTSSDVMWATLKLGWVGGTAYIRIAWNNTMSALVQGAVIAVNKIASVFNSIAAYIYGVIDPIQNAIADLVDAAAKLAGLPVHFKRPAKRSDSPFGITDGGFAKSTVTANSKLQDDLDKALKDFDDAVARAKNRNIDPKLRGPAPADVQAALSTAKDQRTTAGTFNAAAVAGLGGGGQFAPITTRQQQIIAILNRIEKKGPQTVFH